MVNGKCYTVSLTKWNYLRTRLHTRPLFGEDKLTSQKVSRWLRQEKGNLYGEDVLSVQVLMQAVIISLTVLQKQGCRTKLSSLVAPLDEVGVLLGIPCFDTHGEIPTIGDR